MATTDGKVHATDGKVHEIDPPSLHTARLRIAHLKLAESDDLARALRRAAELSARTLEVARVGLWLLGERRATLVPIGVHDSTGMFTGVEVADLPLASWPAYAAAIDSRRVIVAHDVVTDPATRELGEYVAARKITSMLDAPIFLSGDVWGIVCHEHVGPKREWQPREIDFAISVADMISALLEQARRLAAEAALREQEVIAARARRAEALMRMGAGVGHDFNTILQTLTILVGAAANEQDEKGRRELLGSALEECRRGARLTRRLLDFARAQQTVASSLDLGEIAGAMRAGLDALLAPSHRLRLEAQPACYVTADRAELEQVIMNLVTNARDAMPNGGEVRVAIRMEGKSPTLSVSDDGAGIAPEDMDRIFDPFFSTKGPERGSGLGLATVHSIVQTRGGSIDVKSAVGRGTTFRVKWPPA